jgi:hypothetical protein
MALGDLVGISLNQGVRAYDNGDGTFSLQVQTTTGIPTSSVVARYTVVNAFAVPTPGGAVGDLIQSISNYNTTTGVLISVSWQNITQGTSLSGAPNPTDITPVTSGNPYGTQFFTYQAIAPTGAVVAVGDIVQRAANFDLVTGSPVNTWINVTKGTTLVTPNIPGIATLKPIDILAIAKYTSAQHNYIVTTAFGGNLVGDVMARYDVYDPATTPATLLDSTWQNLTQGVAYNGVVSYADVIPAAKNYALAATASLTNVTGAGSTPANLVQASFANIGAANAIVAGTALLPGTSLDYIAPLGGTINAISYDATGTTLAIATLI